MMLSRIHVFAVHVHSRDAKEAAFRTGRGDFAAPVFLAVESGFGDPAFVETLEDVGAEVLVEGGAGAVVGVEALL